ncbi:hypothetical protein D1610_11645 [Sphingomonas gilva]|uniref:Uncharacterized protein n=2 Tax=Sphingomonas gilva TaxID=2305907 RepID=A0A396RN84_9SPHN|nr:hypothetical protein D1610_11645 [Sphingomonas gilva]
MEDAPLGGTIRVSAVRPFRRAGFAFGREPTILTAEDVTPEQLVRLLDEPLLAVHMAMDGRWVTFPGQELAELRQLAEETRGLTRDAIRARLLTGGLNVDAEVQRAMLGRMSSEPGTGAGAKHSAGEHDLVEQPTLDPEPALPVAGAADTNATAAELVADKPNGPESDTAAAIEAGVAAPTSNPADPVAPKPTAPAKAAKLTPAKPKVAKPPAKPAS